MVGYLRVPLITVLLLAGAPVNGAGKIEPFRVIRVIDGDTILGTSRLWPRPVKLRIGGMHTPELHTPQCPQEKASAQKAVRRLAQLVKQAGHLVMMLNVRGPDRWRRPVAEVEIDCRRVDHILIGEGLARPYVGGKRGSWC